MTDTICQSPLLPIQTVVSHLHGGVTGFEKYVIVEKRASGLVECMSSTVGGPGCEDGLFVLMKNLCRLGDTPFLRCFELTHKGFDLLDFSAGSRVSEKDSFGFTDILFSLPISQ